MDNSERDICRNRLTMNCCRSSELVCERPPLRIPIEVLQRFASR